MNIAINLILSILLITSPASSQCPNFNIRGYVGFAVQKINGEVFCSVSCDTRAGYYAAELHTKFNGTINYHTIFKLENGVWVRHFKNTIGDLNCSCGCREFTETGAPHYFVAKFISVINNKPMRYYRANVECKNEFFSNANFKTEDDEKIKFTMDCNCTGPNNPDNWAWTKGTLVKLTCIPGCKRLGMEIPWHNDGFGVLSSCKDIGMGEHSESQLVSSCEGICDKINGYYPVRDEFGYFLCGEGAVFKDYSQHFICEQGCKYDNQNMEIFNERHLKITCKNPFSEDWYSSCNVECEDHYVTAKSGRFISKDVVNCRKGQFITAGITMTCELSCTSFPDSCPDGTFCIGENELGDRFCSKDSIKYEPFS